MVMVCNEIEYLGFIEREGKNGKYLMLKFLDDSMDNFQFYVNPANCKFDVMPHQMESRKKYKLTFEYWYNSYQNRNELVLDNVQVLKA